jgi:hypothetical protein
MRADVADRRRTRAVVLFGWALLYARHGTDWQAVERAPNEHTCEQVRAAHVAGDSRIEIGSALADQPADNPLRQQAAARAERRVAPRYRCAPE